MKVILSVPDEDYSRNASCALNLTSIFFILSEDDDFYRVCYFDNHSQYRSSPFAFTAKDIPATLCSHVIYNSAKIEGNNIYSTEANDLGSNGKLLNRYSV